MNRSYAGTLAVAALLAASLGVPAGAASAAAQPHRQPDHSRDARSQTPAQARAHADRAVAAHRTALRATAGDVFHQRGAVVLDRDGDAHVRYERTHDGLPVLGGDAVVHLDATGQLDASTITLRTQVRVPAAAQVSRRTAMRTAREHFTGSVEATTARQVVDALGGAPARAWEVEIHGVRPDGTPSRLHVLVDASTGAVRRSFDEIAEATGTGRSIYAGTVTIQTGGSAGAFSLVDSTRGNGSTTDLRGATSGTGSTFTDADNVWGNGATSDRASAAVDAHYGAQATYDFFKNVLGRNGIFGDGRGVRSRVHYGNGYDNAFWDGTQMTYGDGAGNARPLVSLDVAGHEMSHGVTENTANLTYSGESGGLNEATSDIFGTLVEFNAGNATDRGDYYIGEKIDINGDGTPLRYMDKPSRDGRSKDCWSPTLGGLDVHFSSGPANHLFYLLAEGSGTKSINGVTYSSPTCDGSSVNGIGRDAAGKIWYRALSAYMTSNTNYAGARAAAVNAATDLYGPASAQCTAVEKAFSAIDVAGATCTTSGPAPAPSGNLLQNPGFENGATGWTATSGAITTDATLAHGGSGLAWLDGYGRSHTDSLAQTVTLPAGKAATLSLWLRIATDETSATSAYDKLRVQVVNGSTTTTLGTYSNLDASGGYVQHGFDLSAYAGRTVTVKLVGSEDSYLATHFLIDDVAVRTG
jgi:Zn-dependent metalloprotease